MIGQFHVDAWRLPKVERTGIFTPEVDVRLVLFWAKNTHGDYLEIGCNDGSTLAMVARECPWKGCHGVDWSQNQNVFPVQSGEVPAVVGRAAKGLANAKIFDCDALTLNVGPLNYGCVFLDADHSLDWQKKMFWRLWNSNTYRDWVLVIHDYGLPEFRDSQTHVETAAFAEWLAGLFPVIHPLGSSCVVGFIPRCGASAISPPGSPTREAAP